MSIEPGYAVTPNIRLVRELGGGGMGAVWIAEHTTLHTEVAVKFVLDELATETSLKRFSREASLAAQIKSPHVVQTYDHGATEEGIPYIVMELLEGESLQERLKRGPLPPRHVAMVIAQVSKALLKAHDLGIVHRDLKPANLFMVESGYEIFVKVLDFGIAKQTGDVKKKTAVMTSELTGARSAIGTPYYMSPEALRASAELDHRADLWSLAVVAYHALTGALPFKGETFGDQLMLVIEQRFKPPSHYRKVSPDLDGWFQRAFHRNIDERFEDAGQLARTFRGAVGAHNSQASFDEDAPVTSVPDSMLETSSEITGEAAPSTAEFAPTEEADSSQIPDTGVGHGDETRTVSPDSSRDVASAESAAAEALTGDGDVDTQQSAVHDASKGSTLDNANTTQPFDGAPKSNRMPMLAAAALVVVGGGYFALRGGDEPPKANATPPEPTPTTAPAASTATAQPEASAAPEPTSEPSAEPAAIDVALTIDSIPPRVTVKHGEEDLGHAPGPVKLPKGDEAVELTFSGPGYLPKKMTVTPDEDQTVTVRLQRPKRAQPKGEPLEW